MRELSPFELDRELARVVPRVRAAYRSLHTGNEVTLRVPDVLLDPETLARVADDGSDPIAAPLLRWLYWLELMHGALGREGERVRRYRVERHALDTPLSGHFSWRELLGHALRDADRRPALLEVLLERGDALRDAGTRLYELRAELPIFAGQGRPELELPCPEIAEVAGAFLQTTRDAFSSLEVRSLDDLLEVGLAHAAADGWPRQLSLRTLNDLLGSKDWLSGLELHPGDLPAAIAPASFARGLLRLGSAWTEALAPASQPFSIAHDPFGLSRATPGALLAGLLTNPTFLKRQLSLGKERGSAHARALGQSALAFARGLALRVLQGAAALEGPEALREAFAEHGTNALGFELAPETAGLLFRPRVGDAQRFSGMLLAASRASELSEDYDEDWHRNPRAVEQVRAEARLAAPSTCSRSALDAGARALGQQLSQLLG
jgi:hypothetical protein